MRKHWRLIAALAGALALAGLTAGQAVAAETLEFVPKSGLYGMKVAVKGGAMEFYDSGFQYGCSGTTTGTGEITSKKAGWVQLELTKCRAEGKAVHNHGKGEAISTEKLPFELVYTSREHHEAALDINYQLPTEKTLNWLVGWELESRPNCGIRGPVLSPATPVNSQVAAFSLALRVEKKLQTPSQYETEAGSKFSAAPETNMLCFSETWEKGGISTAAKLELTTAPGEGDLEIKA